MAFVSICVHCITKDFAQNFDVDYKTLEISPSVVYTHKCIRKALIQKQSHKSIEADNGYILFEGNQAINGGALRFSHTPAAQTAGEVRWRAKE